MDFEVDHLTGLMEAYPEWDPDEEDIDAYREANGLS